MKKTLLLSLAIATTAVMSGGCSNGSKENQQEQPATVEMEETTDTLAAPQDTIKGSIPSEATATIGGAAIKINYHAPGVKDRVIWGGLVPYGQVWVTGAHMATSLETNKTLLIGDKELPAGKYAMFTIPKKDEWTVIINRNWEQHLADKYDEKDDVLRIQVKPETLNQHQERLKYEINKTSETEGAFRISWEKIGVTVPFKVKS